MSRHYHELQCNNCGLFSQGSPQKPGDRCDHCGGTKCEIQEDTQYMFTLIKNVLHLNIDKYETFNVTYTVEGNEVRKSGCIVDSRCININSMSELKKKFPSYYDNGVRLLEFYYKNS